MRGIASFIAGFGNGYFKAEDKKYERERQQKLDAWQEEQQGRQRKEWDRADRLESDLQAAGTPLTVEQPNDVLKDDDGNDMPAVPPLRVGTQRYATMEEATKAAADANTPEAQNSRVVDAYRRAGQHDKALTMQSTLRQGEAADMQLAGLKFQQKLGDWISGGFDGFRDGVNGYEAGPFKGRKIDFIVSPDGKTRTVGLVGEDGTVSPTSMAVPNTQEGLIQLGYMLDRTVTPAQRLAMYRQERKDELDEQKVAIQKRLAAAREKQVDAMSFRLMSGGGGSGGGGRGSAQDGGGTTSFDPLGNFDSKKAQAVAFEQASKAVDANGNPLSPAEQGKLAQKLYRSMEDEFANENIRRQRVIALRNEASRATTPEEIEAVRQRALARGYTPEEMVAIDKRFAPTKDASPTKNAGTNGKTNPDKPTPEKPAAAPYEPPSDSPAGKAKAAREAAQKAAQQQQMQKIAAVTKAASDALASKDPSAAQAVQDMPGFDSLPTAQKAEIRRIVFGR